MGFEPMEPLDTRWHGSGLQGYVTPIHALDRSTNKYLSTLSNVVKREKITPRLSGAKLFVRT
jgi:hypothetical protein